MVSIVRTPSVGSSASKRSNYSRSFELQDDSFEFDRDDVVGGAMLPIFLNDLRRNGTGAYSHGQRGEDLVEVTLEVDDDDSILLCSVAPATGAAAGDDGSGFLSRTASSLRRKLCRLKSLRSRASSSSDVGESTASSAVAAAGDKRGEMKMKAKLMRTKSGAQRALGGLRFISKTTKDTDMNEVWRGVESRFNSLAQNGFLSREDFGECIGNLWDRVEFTTNNTIVLHDHVHLVIGMADSKEFAVGVFDALARRRRQNIGMITKAELHEFWLQISDQSFDARLQIFFDMLAPS